jgi:mannose-6-phosphate isomerase-like protein (cupin superfamily)
VAVAQQPASTAVKTFTSASDVAAMLAKAKAESQPGKPVPAQTLLQMAPYNAVLAYLTAPGGAGVHETEAELFYVVEGSATMVTGGKLVNEKRTNAENLTGTAIEGGSARTVSKGDFIMLPEKTPHWFSAVNSSFAFMALHVPRPVAAH